jgi:hypothetical protein
MDLKKKEINWTWGSYTGNFKTCCILEREAVQCGKRLSALHRNVLPPSSGTKSKRRNQFLLVFVSFLRWGKTESTWYVCHKLAYLPALDDRWCVWSSRWNESLQGKPKYSEETCPSATLSTTNPTWPKPVLVGCLLGLIVSIVNRFKHVQCKCTFALIQYIYILEYSRQ